MVCIEMFVFFRWVLGDFLYINQFAMVKLSRLGCILCIGIWRFKLFAMIREGMNEENYSSTKRRLEYYIYILYLTKYGDVYVLVPVKSRLLFHNNTCLKCSDTSRETNHITYEE